MRRPTDPAASPELTAPTGRDARTEPEPGTGAPVRIKSDPATGWLTRRLLLAGGGGVATAALLGSPLTARADDRGPNWVATWANAQLAPVPADALATAGFEHQTLRHVIQTTAAGRRLRLRFANPFGATGISIGPVTIARRPTGTTGASAAIDPGTIVDVQFTGGPTAEQASDERLRSEPVDVPVGAAGELVVSFHVAGPTGPASFHRRQHATGYVAAGNQVRASADPYTVEHDAAYFLDAIEVDKGDTVGLAVLGDSITEGHRSPMDGNQRLTDLIAGRFNRGGTPVGVANLGISGNRLLDDHRRLGESGLHRFGRDVMGLLGLDAVIIALGINDLRPQPPIVDPADILAAYRRLLHRGRSRGLRMGCATITPFKGLRKWSPELEAVRLAVNEGVRRPGFADAVADFDRAVRDPDDPARMRADLHVGDWLHPNVAGTAALSDSVPAELIKLRARS